MSGVYRWPSDEPALEAIRRLEEEKRNARTTYEYRCAAVKEALLKTKMRLKHAEEEHKRAMDAKVACAAKVRSLELELGRARQQLSEARAAAQRAGKEGMQVHLAENQVATLERMLRDARTQLRGQENRERVWAAQKVKAREAVDRLNLFWQHLTGDGARELERQTMRTDNQIAKLNRLIQHAHERPDL